jgi:hypothetical protein
MRNNIEEINRLTGLYKKAKYDPLIAFLANGEEGKIEILQEQNFNTLISLAKKHHIRYLYIGLGELCGKSERPQSWSPAIWSVAGQLGFRSCGNGDQYQTNDFNGIYFPKDAYGVWDLVENRKLPDKEATLIDFNKVVTRSGVVRK